MWQDRSVLRRWVEGASYCLRPYNRFNEYSTVKYERGETKLIKKHPTCIIH
jgi:hypothetical protein